MRSKIFSLTLVILLITATLISGCGLAAPPEPTATPTNPPTKTPQPTNTPAPTSTNTPQPTKTATPTKTPDLVATEQYSAMADRIAKYVEKGYLTSYDGSYYRLNDFSGTMAQINYLHPYETGFNDSVTDFVWRAHFKWQSAIANPDMSGCGFMFHLSSDGDYYMAFLDKSTLWVGLNEYKRNYVSRIGVTSGSQRVKFDNPAEADFTIVVSGAKLTILVDDRYTATYSMKADKAVVGKLYYTIVSGTNKDYGTRCDITKAELWTVGQ